MRSLLSKTACSLLVLLLSLPALLFTLFASMAALALTWEAMDGSLPPPERRSIVRHEGFVVTLETLLSDRVVCVDGLTGMDG